MDYILQIDGSANPPLYILSVTRDSSNNITGYATTTDSALAISGSATAMIALCNELTGFVGTRPVRKPK